MKVKVIYDNKALDKSWSSGWGFACLVGDRVLFDLGKEFRSLCCNMEKLKIDHSKLEAIIISHDHWDHTGGLRILIGMNNKIKGYICPGFSRSFKKDISKMPLEIIEAASLTRVAPRVYTTGEVKGIYKGDEIAEQALVVHSQRGFSVITGCAHPGIINMLKRVKTQLSIKSFYAVLGGFHLRDKNAQDISKIVQEFLRLKVARVGPAHCSGKEAANQFKKAYQDRYIEMKAGVEIDL